MYILSHLAPPAVYIYTLCRCVCSTSQTLTWGYLQYCVHMAGILHKVPRGRPHHTWHPSHSMQHSQLLLHLVPLHHAHSSLGEGLDDDRMLRGSLHRFQDDGIPLVKTNTNTNTGDKCCQRLILLPGSNTTCHVCGDSEATGFLVAVIGTLPHTHLPTWRCWPILYCCSSRRSGPSLAEGLASTTGRCPASHVLERLKSPPRRLLCRLSPHASPPSMPVRVCLVGDNTGAESGLCVVSRFLTTSVVMCHCMDHDLMCGLHASKFATAMRVKL